MTADSAAYLFNLSEFPRQGHAPLIIEFYAGNILARHSDALIVTAFRGSYHPMPGSVLGELFRRYGIVFGSELPQGTVSDHPRLHLFPVPPCPSFDQLWVLEVKDITDPEPPSMADINAAFFVLKSGIEAITARGATSISMPLVGTGYAGFDTPEVAWKTLELLRHWAKTTPSLQCVRVFARDADKFATLNRTIDKFFGAKSEPAASMLLQAAHEELVASKSILSSPIILQGIQDLIELTNASPASPKSIALAGRRLAETCARLLAGAPEMTNCTLSQLLTTVVQPIVEMANQRWILSYFRLLQHCGNTAAHEKDVEITTTDAAAVTVAALRVAEFTNRHASQFPGPSGI